MAEFIVIDRPAPPIAVLVLNRPEKRNALSTELRDEISDALDTLAVDEELKCLLITGAGSAFCAGFDLAEFDRAFEDEAYAAALWASSDRYHKAVWSFPLPTIAAVNGPALAGGFDLAVLCDIRIASQTARFGHPEFTFGDVVYGPLHDLVGGAVARELAMTGRAVTVEEALGWHLVSEIVDPVLPRAIEIAERASMAPRPTLVRTKAKAMRRAGITTEAGTLDL